MNGLPVFYKQRLRGLYPSWAYTAPGTYLRVYYSATEALIWSCIVYWLTGFAPDVGRYAFLCLLTRFCHPDLSMQTVPLDKLRACSIEEAGAGR